MLPRPFCRTLLLTLTALALVPLATALEAPLEYVDHHKASMARGYQPHSYQSRSFRLANPVPNAKLPPGVGASGLRPLYCAVEFAGTKFLAVIDTPNTKSDFYSRLFFDADGDGDLAEEKPIPGHASRGSGKYRNVSFPALEARIPSGAGALPYRFDFSVRTYDIAKVPGLATATDDKALRNVIRSYTISRCHLLASFSLHGTQYQALLSDNGGNGVFGEPVSVHPVRRSSGGQHFSASGDRIYLAAGRPVAEYDALHCADAIAIGDGVYQMRCTQGREKLVLEPVQGALGILDFKGLDRGMANIALYDADAKRAVSVFAGPPPVRLPAGRYAVLNYTRLKASGGATWRLTAWGSADASPVSVAGGNRAVLAAGEPYCPTLKARSYGSNTARLNMVILGAAGEEVSDLGVVSGTPTDVPMQDRRRPKAPAYKVTDAKGKTVTQGSLNYG